MQALASIAVLEDDFVGLKLPTYRKYQRPDERTLNASTVSQTITAHLQKFTERAPGRGVTAEATRRAQQAHTARRAAHEERCDADRTSLEQCVTLRWQAGADMQPADSQKSMIDNPTLLHNKLTALFIRWQRAQELCPLH